jgi:hypothetical protein
MLTVFTSPSATRKRTEGFRLVVVASSNVLTINLSTQRCTFYALGRFWIFFHYLADDGHRYLAYATSTDRIIWTITNIGVDALSHPTSVAYDPRENAFHLVHAEPTDGLSLRYRRGVPGRDGTIKWDSTQTVFSGVTGTTYGYSTIIVDSNGYPWIGYQKSIDGVNYYPYVVTSSTKDGTWTTAAGFPYQLDTTVGMTAWYIVLTALSNGQVYIAYFRFPLSTTFYGNLWNGSTMEAQETNNSANTIRVIIIVAGIQGDIHVGVANSGPNLTYFRRDYATGIWDAEVTVQNNAFSDATGTPYLTYVAEDDGLCCFWVNASIIYYKRYVNGAWDATPTTWIDCSVDTIQNNRDINSDVIDGGGAISFIYLTLTVGVVPYNLNHTYLSVGKPKEAAAHSAL